MKRMKCVEVQVFSGRLKQISFISCQNDVINVAWQQLRTNRF